MSWQGEVFAEGLAPPGLPQHQPFIDARRQPWPNGPLAQRQARSWPAQEAPGTEGGEAGCLSVSVGREEGPTQDLQGSSDPKLGALNPDFYFFIFGKVGIS